MIKTPWGELSEPKPGKYQNIIEFVNKNGLSAAFKEAVSGDRSIEDYIDEYGETQELARCIISDLSGGLWNEKIKYGNGFTRKFTFKP